MELNINLPEDKEQSRLQKQDSAAFTDILPLWTEVTRLENSWFFDIEQVPERSWDKLERVEGEGCDSGVG